ncbi:hypothetical protein CR513_12371, partial [Mucuna pruriens]
MNLLPHIKKDLISKYPICIEAKHIKPPFKHIVNEVLKENIGPNGSIEKFKTRLVIKDFTQKKFYIVSARTPYDSSIHLKKNGVTSVSQ